MKEGGGGRRGNVVLTPSQYYKKEALENGPKHSHGRTYILHPIPQTLKPEKLTWSHTYSICLWSYTCPSPQKTS